MHEQLQIIGTSYKNIKLVITNEISVAANTLCFIYPVMFIPIHIHTQLCSFKRFFIDKDITIHASTDELRLKGTSAHKGHIVP